MVVWSPMTLKVILPKKEGWLPLRLLPFLIGYVTICPVVRSTWNNGADHSLHITCIWDFFLRCLLLLCTLNPVGRSRVSSSSPLQREGAWFRSCVFHVSSRKWIILLKCVVSSAAGIACITVSLFASLAYQYEVGSVICANFRRPGLNTWSISRTNAQQCATAYNWEAS